MHNTFLLYLGLLFAILFLVMLAKKLNISYPIVLVLGGLTLSFIPALPDIKINPDVIFLIFLPPLLYEAAWNTSWKEFWKWRRVISVFAFLIVILTSCIVAVISNSLIPGFTIALGFLLGGIVSPPDAVAATSVLKNINVPKRVVSIIEGESLLNDASSLIVFRFALQAVNTGRFVFHEALLNFFIVIIMGIATGIAIALIFYAIHRWLPTTANIDILLTFLTPYCMYIVAERFHFSGVLAVVSGGLFLSSKSDIILNYRSRFQGVGVWSTVAFALNGLVFMLIGLELPVIEKDLGSVSLNQAIIYGLIISGVLIIARLLCTLGSSVFTTFISRYIKTADNNPGWRGPVVFGWAGMRGVVSLAAALSIPLVLENNEQFPQRDLIIFITFIVILVTLVLQGLTLPSVIKWMNLEETDYPLSFEKQEMRITKKLATAALKLLHEKYSNEIEINQLLRNLQQRYETDVKLFDVPDEVEFLSEAADGSFKNYTAVATEIFNEQRALLNSINKKAEVDEDVIKKHLMMIDIEEEKLRLWAGEQDGV